MSSASRRPSPYSSVQRPHVDRGISLVEKAKKKEKEGNISDAIKLYGDACEHFMEEIRVHSGRPESKSLKEYTMKILEHAESLHKVAPKNSTSSTTPSGGGTNLASAAARIASARSSDPQCRGARSATISKASVEIRHRVLDEVVDNKIGIGWNDIIGLEAAKETLHEAVILPSLRPDIFSGVRSPPKGVLLFGPPGTGKTMLAKAVASESEANFFNISASAIMSKWVGEGEKFVKELFAVAREVQPSVIFIDEIDSVLSKRQSNEHDATMRVKTEIDGVSSSSEDRVLILGATNRPDAIDDAVIRRFPKRIYIPLPGTEERAALLRHLLHGQRLSLTSREFKSLVQKLDGYSCSDISALVKDAALGPIRELGKGILNVKLEELRAISAKDFDTSLQRVRKSVPQSSLQGYIDWSREYGMDAQ